MCLTLCLTVCLTVCVCVCVCLSVSAYAPMCLCARAKAPWEPCTGATDARARGCGILLSLSGVGVKANDQVDAHKYKQGSGKRRDFIFGFERSWVLAPEREGAHNWEGSGFQNAMHCIHALARAVAAHPALGDQQVDVSSRLYTGHSRGGHGSYMVGMHHPDTAKGVASLSGWWRREQYADANILFDLDQQLEHLDPALRAVLEASIIDHDSSLLAANLIGLPVMLRTGDQDGSVPSYHTRRMARLLRELTVNVSFTELAGKGHW